MHSKPVETPIRSVRIDGRISNRSTGQFDPKNWFTEGDGFLASSKKTREIWTNHRHTFSNTVEDWNLLTGLPRASMLLLGYSVEMYLKAGLAKAYFGCSEKMFERDVKCFGHRLVCLAKQIDFPLKDEEKKNLNLLKGMILVDARYPLSVQEGMPYADAVNQQTGRIWNPGNFEILTELTNRIKEHSRTIDKDPHNPGFHKSVNTEKDGYLAFRVGGNLPPRITYRPSSFQKQDGNTSLNDIKDIIFASPEFRQLRYYWDRAWIYEDGEKKTSLLAQP